MIEITYTDSYKQNRTLQYDCHEDFVRAFAGCVTVPDYLKVTSVTVNGHDIGYSGIIGDLYRDLSQLDLSPYL